MFTKLFKRKMRGFKAEDGSATIEAVLWLPFYMLAFSLTFDVTMMFVAETEAVRVVQDANRLASIGRLETSSDIESFLKANLTHLSANITANSTINGSGIIRTVVTIPSADLQIMGRFAGLNSIDLTIAAEHMKEDFK